MRNNNSDKINNRPYKILQKKKKKKNDSNHSMQRYLQSTFETQHSSQPSSLDREADKPRGPGADCPPGKTENLYSLANTAVRFSGSSARPGAFVARIILILLPQ